MKSYLNGKEVKNWHDIGDVESLFANSAFLWGESIFTTGRLENGKLHLWEGHLCRLVQAYKWLTLENLDVEALNREVTDIITKLEKQQKLRFRLTYFYNANGNIQRLLTFAPFIEKEDLTLVSTQIPLGVLRDKKVKVGQYADVNVLKRSLGGELCLLSSKGEVLESSTSNFLFFNNEDKWLTPDSDEFILEGVGLHTGLKSLNINKKIINYNDLKEMKAAFAINAVHGPVPILKIDDINFSQSKKYLVELKEKWGKE